MIRLSPISTRTYTLFPDTTLFRSAGRSRPPAVPGGDRRRGAGRERRRHRGRRAEADRTAAGRHLPGQGQDLERPGDRRGQPGRDLPASKINLVQRSDGSGTTFNFTNYLTKVSPDRKSTRLNSSH